MTTIRVNGVNGALQAFLHVGAICGNELDGAPRLPELLEAFLHHPDAIFTSENISAHHPHLARFWVVGPYIKTATTHTPHENVNTRSPEISTVNTLCLRDGEGPTLSFFAVLGLFDQGRSILDPVAPVTSSNLHLFRFLHKNYGGNPRAFKPSKYREHGIVLR